MLHIHKAFTATKSEMKRKWGKETEIECVALSNLPTLWNSKITHHWWIPHASQSISIFYWKFRNICIYLWNPLNLECFVCAFVWAWIWPNEIVFLFWMGNSLIRDFSFVFHLVGWTTFKPNAWRILGIRNMLITFETNAASIMQHSLLTHSQKCVRERGRGLAYTEKAFWWWYWRWRWW